ncbi:hypothetical protein LTR56_027429 [Elasticomyces elasticus]|nr:hypothetical protein LTR56_027429 [Elasticomyces elasticus]KAK5733061.1 hypothetical protein LTS12_027016 [Elasticomyces elasticus]
MALNSHSRSSQRPRAPSAKVIASQHLPPSARRAPRKRKRPSQSQQQPRQRRRALSATAGSEDKAAEEPVEQEDNTEDDDDELPEPQQLLEERMLELQQEEEEEEHIIPATLRQFIFLSVWTISYSGRKVPVKTKRGQLNGEASIHIDASTFTSKVFLIASYNR